MLATTMTIDDKIVKNDRYYNTHGMVFSYCTFFWTLSSLKHKYKMLEKASIACHCQMMNTTPNSASYAPMTLFGQDYL